jgi:hypothetical protein
MLLPVTTRIAIGTFCILLLVSCTCEGVPKGFFRKPPDQQDAEFLKYDFDTQYKIYICGNQSVEPPMMHLASAFASEGTSVVNPLRKKLENATRDKDVRDIVRVFRVMSDLATYNVAADKPLMQELRLKVSDMRDDFWRELAEENLAAIREKSQKKS